MGHETRAESPAAVIIEWAPRAVDHLQSLREYIAHENTDAATEIANLILAAVERLAELPNAGRPGRLAGTREFVVPNTKYLIAYRVRGQRLEVLAVLHGRRKWPTHL